MMEIKGRRASQRNQEGWSCPYRKAQIVSPCVSRYFKYIFLVIPYNTLKIGILFFWGGILGLELLSNLPRVAYLLSARAEITWNVHVLSTVLCH